MMPLEPMMAKKEAVKKKIKAKKVGNPVTDVLTGRALVEGAKVVGRWATQNVARTEKRHQQINGYKGK